MIVYYRLMEMISKRNMSKQEFRDLIGISTGTMNSLSKNRSITTETIDRICKAFNCQPGDIMEFIPNESYEEIEKQAKKIQKISSLEKQIEKLNKEIYNLKKEI